MFKPKSSFTVTSNIKSLPFHDLASALKGNKEAKDEVVAEFIEKFGLKHKAWLYPQLLAHVGKWTLSRDEDNLFSAVETLKQNCTDDYNIGIYHFLTSNNKALAKQYDKEQAHYCNLVPLILSAFKKMSGIMYNDWNKKGLSLLVHSRLWEAMNTPYYHFSEDKLLEFREIGLTTKSGKSAGVTKSPVSTYGLNGTPREVVIDETTTVEGPGSWPQLVRMMICQTWCAHPNNRNKYMVLDPEDWDSMPKPLVETEILLETENSAKRVLAAQDEKLPWE